MTPNDFQPAPDVMKPDPRFDFRIMRDPHTGKLYVDNPMEGRSEFNPQSNPTPWVDIPFATQMGDIHALLAGHGGTSVGDSWDPQTVKVVHAMASAGLTPGQIVTHLKAYFIKNRIPHFMQQHPGKAAYYEK